MNRLTRKTDGRDYWLYCRQVEFDNEVLERNDTLLYEESQDYYNRFPYQTSEVGNEEEILNKLGELEDIEEELGISLPILFKALKDGIYFTFKHIGNYENYNNKYKNKTYKIIPTIKFYLKENKINWCLEVNHEDWKYCYQVSLKDYGKTWWLKEDLKSE